MLLGLLFSLGINEMLRVLVWADSKRVWADGTTYQFHSIIVVSLHLQWHHRWRVILYAIKLILTNRIDITELVQLFSNYEMKTKKNEKHMNLTNENNIFLHNSLLPHQKSDSSAVKSSEEADAENSSYDDHSSNEKEMSDNEDNHQNTVSISNLWAYNE